MNPTCGTLRIIGELSLRRKSTAEHVHNSASCGLYIRSVSDRAGSAWARPCRIVLLTDSGHKVFPGNCLHPAQRLENLPRHHAMELFIPPHFRPYDLTYQLIQRGLEVSAFPSFHDESGSATSFRAASVNDTEDTSSTFRCM